MKFVSTTDQENKVKFKLQATGIAVDVGPFEEGDNEHHDVRLDVSSLPVTEPIDSSAERELHCGLDAKRLRDTNERSPDTNVTEV